MSTSDENKGRARQYFRALEEHSDGHMDNLEEFVTPDIVNHSPVSSDDATPGETHGIEAFRPHAESVTTTLPDLHFDIQNQIAEGDQVVTRFVLSGTFDSTFMSIEPTGDEVTMSGIVIYRFEAGKIAERWGEVNTMTLLQQIGRIPS